MRPVFGIIDRHIGAANAGQRIGERLWLGAGQVDRHQNDLVFAPQPQSLDRRDCCRIIRLANQLDIEPRARPVDLVERVDELRHDTFFPVERHEHRIDRYRPGGDGRQCPRPLQRQALLPPGGPQRVEAHQKIGKIEQGQHDMQHQDADGGQGQCHPDQAAQRDPGIKTLLAPKGDAGAVEGRGFKQHARYHRYPPLAARLPGGSADRRWCRDGQALAQHRHALQQRGKFGEPADRRNDHGDRRTAGVMHP